MRVCHMTTVHRRDDLRIFRKECVALASARHVVYLVVADGCGDENLAGVQILDVGRAPCGRLGRASLSVMRVFWRSLQTKARVFHFHDSELLTAGLLLRLLGRKVIYDVHEDVPRSLVNRLWVPLRLRPVVGALVGGAEVILGRIFSFTVAATPTIGRRFSTRNTILVRNFAIPEELTGEKGPPISQREPIFVYVGAVSNDRGALVMVQAINEPLVANRARLEIVGDVAPELYRILSAADTGGLVKFHGQQPRANVAKLLSRAKAGIVLLQPVHAHMHAYPVKMFEYLAVGLPVIASDYPLWRELLDDGRLGFLVGDPTSPVEIAKLMSSVLDSPDLDKLSAAGMEAVAGRYSWNTEAQTLCNAYASLSR